MKVLVVGSGAREHALAWKISQSPLLSELLAAPGNPGIASVARCVSVRADDLEGLVELAAGERVDLVVVGPEDPLAAGLVDRLQSRRIAAFGPSAAAARLEASKAFAKDLMIRHGIPTARYEVVSSFESAVASLDHWNFPIAVKADGLARGRGVTLASTREEAEDALRRCMVENVFGLQGATVVLEEYLEGEEISLIALCDGKRALPLAPAEDHKQVFDGDRGPNTGGMGCFSPVPALDRETEQWIISQVVRKTVDALASEGIPFRGALFAGLMLTAQGPRVLEFNVRFGDPETEVILPRMKTDLLPLLKACAEGSLGDGNVEWRSDAAVTVILASGGYPTAFETGKSIQGLDAGAFPESVQVFHAGTAAKDGGLVTAGGRVLAVTALGSDLEDAARRAYAAADRISFEGLHRRNDIGHRRAASAPVERQ